MMPQFEPAPNTDPILDGKKVFEVHLDALKDAYKEIIDANQKIAGILLIVLGWFAAKDNPLSMLCHIPYMAVAAIGLAIAGFFAIVYLFRSVYARAEATYVALTDLGHSKILFSRFHVSKTMLVCGLFGQFTLLTGIITLIATKYILNSAITCR
jgi:hypothetical protein